MQWNTIRRRLTRELDTQIAEWRERALNKLLTPAFERFAESLTVGEVLELEAHYDKFVGEVLSEIIAVDLEDEEPAPNRAKK